MRIFYERTQKQYFRYLISVIKPIRKRHETAGFRISFAFIIGFSFWNLFWRVPHLNNWYEYSYQERAPLAGYSGLFLSKATWTAPVRGQEAAESRQWRPSPPLEHVRMRPSPLDNGGRDTGNAHNLRNKKMERRVSLILRALWPALVPKQQAMQGAVV